MGTFFTKGDSFCFENTLLFSQNFCPSQQRAFLSLSQLLQIYKSENENSNFCPHYKRDRDLEEKDSLRSYIRIKLGCCSFVLIYIRGMIRDSPILFFHCSACPC